MLRANKKFSQFSLEKGSIFVNNLKEQNILYHINEIFGSVLRVLIARWLLISL